MTTSLATQILHTLTDAGHQAYMVGGYVRDQILERPSKDIDIATSATPDEVQKLFPKSDLIGAHFGVVLVKEGDEAIEVATFRLDGAYKDGRHPESVAFTTSLEEDMKRRDFTINAFAMDINGRVHDSLDGLYDIEFKLIRAVGDPGKRFEEDALRMLRAVRFACQLGFYIEERTFECIKVHASRIKQISVERVREELNKILTSGKAAYGLHLLFHSNLLVYVMPEVVRLYGCPQNPLHHPEGDVFTHTFGLLVKLPKDCSLTLALAALLHDIGKPATLKIDEVTGLPTFHGHEEVGATMAYRILTRLKYPTDTIAIVVRHVEQHMRFRNVREMRRSKLFRFIGQPYFAELLELHKLDAQSGSGNLDHARYVENVMAEVPETQLKPTPLITGRDLIALGLRPGPLFKEILEGVETEQLEGKLLSHDGALAYVRETWSVTPQPAS